MRKLFKGGNYMRKYGIQFINITFCNAYSETLSFLTVRVHFINYVIIEFSSVL